MLRYICKVEIYKEDLLMDTEEEIKEAVGFESAEDAYRVAATAVNIEDAVEAIAYLRDSVNSLTAELGNITSINAGLTERVANLTDKLSAAMLSIPVGDPVDGETSTEVALEQSETLDDLLEIIEENN